MEKIYETDRLIHRVFDRSHAQMVLDYYIRNKKFLEEWEALRDEDFYTLDFQEKQIENELVNMERGESLRLWISKKENCTETIGCIAFNSIVRGAFQSCFLGYKLDRDEINKGYITEALKKGIEIIFSEYKLHRIEANIMPKNKRSLRVAEKLGFYHEGTAYKYLNINGKWEDHIHMVLLNEAL